MPGQVMTDQPRLPFNADQATYDAWYAAGMARVRDPDDSFMFVDLNDEVMVFVAARTLADQHPDKIKAFLEHGPVAVELAGIDLGMFMGISWLCEKVGIDPEEGRQVMLGIFK